MKKFFLMVVTAAILWPLLFSSCTSTKYLDEVNKIDSLLIVLDESEVLLNKADTNEIAEHFEIYLNNLDRIRDHFTDRDDEEAWSIYTRYGLLRKPLRDYKKNYHEFMGEIRYARQQLHALKDNLRRNTFEPEQVEEYMHEEATFVEYIRLSSENLYNNTSLYHGMFIELTPKIDSLLEN